MFWHQGWVLWKTVFPQTGGGEGGWFQDNSSTFHLLRTLFLLLLHQIHLRSSGIRSQRLGTPALEALVPSWSCGLGQEVRLWPSVMAVISVKDCNMLRSFWVLVGTMCSGWQHRTSQPGLLGGPLAPDASP